MIPFLSKKVAFWCDRAVFLCWKQPTHFCIFWVPLHYLANIFFSWEEWDQDWEPYGSGKVTQRPTRQDNAWLFVSERFRALRFMFEQHLLASLFTGLDRTRLLPGTVSHKSEVCAARIHCTKNLTIHVTEGVGTINGASLKPHIQNFRQWLRHCVECHGYRLEQVMFKKRYTAVIVLAIAQNVCLYFSVCHILLRKPSHPLAAFCIYLNLFWKAALYRITYLEDKIKRTVS